MAKKLKRRCIDRLYAAEHPGCTDFVIGVPKRNRGISKSVKENKLDLLERRIKLLEEDMDAVQRELAEFKKAGQS